MTINAAYYDNNNLWLPPSSGISSTVGTNGKPSYFGTYDQTGNIAEYTEKSVLLSSSDRFSPITTPISSDAFMPAAITDPSPTWPLPYPPPPPPPAPPPYPVPPIQPPDNQGFAFAKQVRGGSFVSSSGDLSNISPLAYMLPTEHNNHTGFRIASIAEEVTISGIHISSSTTANIMVPSDQISNIKTTMNMQSESLTYGQEVMVVGISTNIVPSGGKDYQYVNLSVAPGFAAESTTAVFSLMNPTKIKNMVLVDQANNSPDGFTPGYGRVTKNYYIGKYPVTNSEYAAYLNSVATHDTDNAFYTPAKSSADLGMAVGIIRNGTINHNPPYTYSVVPRKDDKPLVGVTWLQAARYCNWLHNRHINSSTSSTNSGSYDLSQLTQTLSRSSIAKYFIPTENEWYKAAYYDKEGGIFVWKNYATRTDEVPDRVPVSSINRFGDGPYRNLSDVSLFDRYCIDKINDTRWTSIINRAMDRWDAHISLIEYTKETNEDYKAGYNLRVKNASRYLAVKSLFENRFNIPWRGIHFPSINFINKPGSGMLASCSITNGLAYTVQNNIARYMPMTARININTAYSNTFSNTEWIDILTHELGHALGIGILWKYIPNINSDDSVVDGVYLSTIPFNKTAKIYNEISYRVYNGYHRYYTPLEQSGSAGTRGAHWENNFNPDGLCHVPLNCGEAVSWAGISNELMNGYYVAGSVLSSLSIANLIDLGYYPKTGSIAGEGDFTPVYDIETEGMSIVSSKKSRILGRCSL